MLTTHILNIYDLVVAIALFTYNEIRICFNKTISRNENESYNLIRNKFMHLIWPVCKLVSR